MSDRTREPEEKQAFRLEWAAQKQSQKVVSKRSKLKEIEETVGEKGKYLAFDRMCAEEGGLSNPLAVRRCLHYTKDCLKRGFPYVIFCKMKKSVEFLYFTKTRENLFRNSWGLSAVESHEVDAGDFQFSGPGSRRGVGEEGFLF